MSWSHDIEGQPAVPRVIGADLSPYPYISGFGLAQRIATFALLSGGELARLGLKNRTGLDVLLATQRHGKARSTFLCALGLDMTNVAAYWSPDAWSPMDCPGLFSRHVRPLRQCWECAQYGYHCALFQLPSIHHCPWHRVPLECTCPRCGRIQFARFTDDDRLGVCGCGFSVLDPRTALAEMHSFPARQCASWVDEYLDWARHQRSRRFLYVPESNQQWDEAFSALEATAAPLQLVKSVDQQSPAPLCFGGQGADPEPDSLWGWSHLGGSQSFRLAPLPRFVFDVLREITEKVIAESELDDTIVTYGDGSSAVTRPRDQSCMIAPYGIASSGHTWLNLAIVDKEVTFACGAALALTAQRLTGPSDPLLSPQAAIGVPLGGLQGRRHLVDAMLACLCRGYTQGLIAMLRHARPGAQTSAPPALEVPVIEIHAHAGVIEQVRVAWAPSPSARRIPSSSARTPHKHAKARVSTKRKKRAARSTRK